MSQSSSRELKKKKCMSEAQIDSFMYSRCCYGIIIDPEVLTQMSGVRTYNVHREIKIMLCTLSVATTMIYQASSTLLDQQLALMKC